MSPFVQPAIPEDQQRFCSLAGLFSLTPEVIAQQRPDALWMLVADDDTPTARCSLWWSNTPSHDGKRLGYLGHYAARDASSAARLLTHACSQLARQGCALAVGPMDGNTWNRYRLLSERGSEPTFFLEPDNPDDWPAHFLAADFEPLAQYFSALNPDLGHTDPRTAELARRLQEQGVRLRALDPSRFEEELRALCPVALASFANNFLYSPISPQEFLALYLPVRPHLRPELVLIAEKDEQPVGFVLTVPDLSQARRGQAIDTVIVKTVAVHPDHAGGGLGTLLVARTQEEAGRLGYRRAIHALMHETNHSRRISGHSAHTIRRYTLYARQLGPAS